jgi:hypothetical protein
VAPDFARLLTVAVAGDLSPADLSAIFRHEREVERRYGPVLVDASGAFTTMSAVDVERSASRLTAVIAQAGPKGPVAIIATDDHLFALMRLLEVICERRGIGLSVFQNREAAVLWLAGSAWANLNEPLDSI